MNKEKVLGFDVCTYNKENLLKEIFKNYDYDDEEISDFLERFYKEHFYFDPRTRKPKTFLDIWKENYDDYLSKQLFHDYYEWKKYHGIQRRTSCFAFFRW